MKKICTCLFFSLVLFVARSQTFTGTGGVIPDNGSTTPTLFPVTVSGVGNIDGNYGLASVCINIVHQWDGDLEIMLKAPNGTIVPLSFQNGSSSDNYTNTCFTMTAIVPIGGGTAPFTGTYLPNGNLGYMNNGQNADGQWFLSVLDVFAGQSGSVTNFSITFNNTPAPPAIVPPGCGTNQPASDACNNAPLICGSSSFCGTTLASYNIDTWLELTSIFCGSLENNSFAKFVATDNVAKFYLYVTSAINGDGVQLIFYDGGCGSGAINVYGCYGQIYPNNAPDTIYATGLTPGNTYYMMIDGWAGDVCDYVLEPVSGIASGVFMDYPVPVACVTSSIPLTPTLLGSASGTYSSVPAGLNINPTTGSIIPNLSSVGNYTVTYTPGTTGVCTGGTGDLTKTISIVDTNGYEWTGAVSTAWEDPGNWACGHIPDETTQLVLTHGTIVINSNVTLYSLVMGPAVNLTVNTGFSLTILH
ncbi:MAG: proprotein convertase P-domain-containing protein [Ferruginibacter sp.]